MNDLAHGTFHIEIVGNIIHGYPEGAFNPEGVSDYYETILKEAEQFNGWGYFLHTNDNYGMTPEAKAMIPKYIDRLVENSCVAMGLLVTNMVAESIANRLRLEISLPICVSSDCSEIEAFFVKEMHKGNHC